MMKEWDRGQFNSFLDSGSTGLVYFYTPLCGTCQIASKMLRIIDEIVNEELGTMNINWHPELAKEMNIESIPCLLFIQEGKVVEKLHAFHSVPFLYEKINKMKR